MTLSEYIRANNDETLAALMTNWIVTIVLIMGGDPAKLKLDIDFYEILNFLRSPIPDDVVDAINTVLESLIEPTDLLS